MPLSIVLENYMKQPNKIFEVTHFSLEYIIYAKSNFELPELVVPVLRKRVASRLLQKEVLKNLMADRTGLLDKSSQTASLFIVITSYAHHSCLNNHLLKDCLSMFPEEVGGHSFQELLEAGLKYGKDEITAFRSLVERQRLFWK